MLKSDPVCHGYVCIPYNHDQFTIDVKDMWSLSRNIESIYFVTATFSAQTKPYFPTSTNHYMLAKFVDDRKIINDAKKFTTNNPSFVFSIDEKLFQRYANNEQRFVSMYYLEHTDHEIVTDLANTLVMKDKIHEAGFAHLNLFCQTKQKFIFPYTEKLVILEATDTRSHQSICKYCEKISHDISRKGIVMHNFVSLSLLEKLK